MGENVPTILVVTCFPAVSETANEFVESPLLGVASSGTESEIVEISPGENVGAEPTGVVIESHSDELPKALKRGLLSALADTRKLLQKGG
jgi:hypothetical protein